MGKHRRDSYKPINDKNAANLSIFAHIDVDQRTWEHQCLHSYQQIHDKNVAGYNNIVNSGVDNRERRNNGHVPIRKCMAKILPIGTIL